MSKWVFASFLLLSPLLAIENLPEIGHGAKAAGMGGVAIALPQDAFTVGNNPAGLTHICNRLDLGIPGIAARTRWAKNQALGGAAYPYGWDDDYSALFFSPAWAWQINCRHSVGVALNLAFERFDPTDHTPDYEWGISARFGWITTFCPFQLGLTFQVPTIFSPLRKYRNELPDGGRLNLPPELGAGIAYCCGPLRLGFDIVEIFWRSVTGFERSNQAIWKVGASYTYGWATLRAGYGDDRGTVGLTLRRGRHELSAAYMSTRLFSLAYGWRF